MGTDEYNILCCAESAKHLIVKEEVEEFVKWRDPHSNPVPKIYALGGKWGHNVRNRKIEKILVCENHAKKHADFGMVRHETNSDPL